MWNDTDVPLAHLITFRCYATWLHGDSRGTVDRFHNQYKSPYLSANESWLQHNKRKLKHEPVNLNATQPHSPWVTKGSKRNLWNERSVERAVDYVLYGQGDELPDFD